MLSFPITFTRVYHLNETLSHIKLTEKSLKYQLVKHCFSFLNMFTEFCGNGRSVTHVLLFSRNRSRRPRIILMHRPEARYDTIDVKCTLFDFFKFLHQKVEKKHRQTWQKLLTKIKNNKT